MTATALFLALAVILHAFAGAVTVWLTANSRAGRSGWGLLTAAVLVSGVHAGVQLVRAVQGQLGESPELAVSLVLVGGLLALASTRLSPMHRDLARRARQRETAERKFRAFFEELPVGVALSEIGRAHTRMVEHNPALSEFLGMSEGTGSLSIDLLAHPDDLGEGPARLAQLTQGSEHQVSYEQRYILKDGRMAWGLVTTSILRDAQGKPTHTLSAVQDITDRKRTEEALREERDRANTILDVAEVLLIHTDTRGEITLANRKAAEVLGRPLDTLIGANWLDVGFTDSSRQLAQDLLHALVDGETLVSPAFEGRIEAPDGNQRVVAWRCATVRDEAGSITGTLCAGIDVTGRTEALTRFRQERGRVASIMETSPIAVVVVDRRGRLIYANREAEEQLGTSIEQGSGKTFIAGSEWTVVDWAGEPVPFEELPFGKVIRTKDPLRDGRYALRYPDGRTKRLLVNLTPLTEEDHGVDGVVATLQDVSGALELDARARRAERMDAIRRLALGAAHDFNNVLTAIVGTAELGMATHPEGNTGEQFATIHASALAAAELTSRLQSIGSLKPLAPVSLRMSEIGAAAQAAAEAVGETRAIRDTLPPGEELRVAADRSALEVVIAALLRNAREAAGDGEVKLGTRLIDLPPGGEHPPGTYVEMAVTDEGPGIPPETRERMFEPYFSTRPGRPGLGLSEANSVVTRMGGHFVVSDGPTTVALRLPTRMSTDTPAPPQSRTITDLPRGTETVLVVEDEDEVVTLLRMVLERQGYTVRSAKTLLEARAEAKAGDVDLLLTDVQLPDGQGTALASELRVDNPGLPVVFTSGMDDEHLDLDLEGRAHTQFIAKPFTVRSIAVGVREALDA